MGASKSAKSSTADGKRATKLTDFFVKKPSLSNVSSANAAEQQQQSSSKSASTANNAVVTAQKRSRNADKPSITVDAPVPSKRKATASSSPQRPSTATAGPSTRTRSQKDSGNNKELAIAGPSRATRSITPITSTTTSPEGMRRQTRSQTKKGAGISQTDDVLAKNAFPPTPTTSTRTTRGARGGRRAASAAVGPKPSPKKKGKSKAVPATELSDSEADILTPSPSKRRRLSSPAPAPSSSPPISPCSEEQLIPTSDPDEVELTLPSSHQPSHRAVSRDTSLLSSLPPTDDDHDRMDVDTEPAASRPSTPVQVDHHPLTPPPTTMAASHDSSPSRPSSPVALDAESKTAQIIAEIRAKAMAEALLSSPEPLDPDEVILRDLSDDSDDDVLPIAALNTRSKGKVSLPSTSTSTQAGPSSRRYNLRATRTSPKNKYPTLVTSASRSTSPTVARDSKKRRKSSVNPINKLLREQKHEEAAGFDDDAFARAEQAASSPLRETTDDEEEGDDESDRDADEEEGDGRERQHIEMPSTPTRGGRGKGRMVIGENSLLLAQEDCDRLLGDGKGGEIKSLLEGDVKHVQEEEKEVGLRMWLPLARAKDDEEEGMDVDSQEWDIPTFPDISRGGKFVDVLRKALDELDYLKVQALLNSGLLSTLDPRARAGIVPWLCELALTTSLDSNDLSLAAFRAVSNLWSSPCKFSEAGISLKIILNTLVRLGADPEIFRAQSWNVDCQVKRDKSVTSDRRDEILWRLGSLVRACAVSGALSTSNEVPDIMVSLLTIAMDSSTPHEIGTDVALTIHEICSRLVPTGDQDIFAAKEIALCNRLLQYASTMITVNKAHLMGLLTVGSGRTMRVARWVAYGILLDLDNITIPYTQTPPLDAIPGVLNTSSESGCTEGEGKFDVNRGTDYQDMCAWIRVLSVVLSDVEASVQDEKRRVHAASPVSRVGSSTLLAASTSMPTTPNGKRMASKSPRKSLRSPTKSSPAKSASTNVSPVKKMGSTSEVATGEAPMLQVLFCLENLHAKITDTQAAHLDRSRAKEDLKRLSIRVRYQRKAVVDRSTSAGLHKFFKPKSTAGNVLSAA